MNVRADFLNGHQICHGGLIFTLADSTFAFACNSHNTARSWPRAVSIEFLQPVQGRRLADGEGVEQMLRAARHLRHEGDQPRGETVAMFRGKSAQIQGTVIPA